MKKWRNTKKLPSILTINQYIISLPKGAQTTYQYDELGNVTALIDPLNNETTYTYDPNNRLVSVLDPLGNSTQYEYDALGSLIGLTDANGNKKTWEYNKNGQVLKENDALGQTKQYQYDKAGQLIQEIAPDLTSIEYTYTPLGQINSVNSADENINYSYDIMGNLIEMQSMDAHDRFQYDYMGRVTYQENVDLDKILRFQYDNLGNLTQLTNSEDRVTQYTYDNRNLVKSLIDPEENITTFEYDPLGREISRNLANGNKIVKSYNEDGNLTSITNYQQDNILSSFEYEYDLLGNRISQTEEDGAITTYNYDPLSRLTEVNYPLEKISQMVINTDEKTNLEDIELPEELPDSNTKDKVNNGKGNLKAISSALNNIGLVASLDLNTLFIAKNDKSDGNSNSSNNGNSANTQSNKNEDKTNNGNGKDKNSSILGAGFIELPEVLDIKPDYLIQPQSTVKYTYDSVGNRLSMENDEGITNYTYNEANQLIKTDNTDYVYDKRGNLTRETANGNTKEYTYNRLNLLKEVTYSDGSYVKYGYDALGRKISREEASYDLKALEEMTENNNAAKNSSNPSSSKTNENSNKNNKDNSGSGYGKYDNPGQGNKYGLYKQLEDELPLNIENTRYFYQGLSNTVHKEYSDKGSPYAEYYVANSQIISKKMFGLHGLITPGQEETLKTNGGLMYYQYDGNRNVTELTNKHGDKIEHYRYDVFGNIFTGVTAPYNTNGYTGQEYDGKSGLVYMNARWYNSNDGRFTTPDTYFGSMMNPQSQNLYAYVMNNPVNMWDPSGHVPSWVGDSIHYKVKEGTNYVDWAYFLKSYSSSSSGWQSVGSEETATQITYNYKARNSKTWVYDYLDVHFVKKYDEDTGEAYYEFTGYSHDEVTFHKTNYYYKSVVKKASAIAEENKEYINNLAGDPPKDTDPPAFSISEMNGQVLVPNDTIGSSYYNNIDNKVVTSTLKTAINKAIGINLSYGTNNIVTFAPVSKLQEELGLPENVLIDKKACVQLEEYILKRTNSISQQDSYRWDRLNLYSYVPNNSSGYYKNNTNKIFDSIKSVFNNMIDNIMDKLKSYVQPPSSKGSGEDSLIMDFTEGYMDVPNIDYDMYNPKGTSNVEDRFEYIWTGEYVTTEFKEKVVEISDRLEMNPDDLMGIMAFESWLDPTTVNSIGATGLIQFMPSTAKWLGTSTDELVKMSAIEQLDYVEKYFKSFTGNLNDISDAYMTVLLPVAVGKDKEFALGVKGSDEIFFGKITYGQFYKNNSGLDYNGDGKITKWEATKKVIERRDTYEKK